MGEENIFKMLSDFYKELEKSSIRSLFPGNMEEASQKSAKFFVQVLGGPPLYVIDHGPPRMRARHLPFDIDEQARQVWLSCFENVLVDAEKKYNFPPQHLQGFKDFLRDFSAWMVNKAN
jgi:hemoglobin